MSDSHTTSASSDTASKQSRSDKGGLRPLAPRLPSTEFTRLAIGNPPPTTVQTLRGPLPCRLCFRIGCRLLTHKDFHVAVRENDEASSGSSGHDTKPKEMRFAASYAYGLAQQYIDQGIASSKTDPFYNLPVKANFNTPEMHRLFHDWFTVEAQNIFQIRRPPEMVSDPLSSAFFMPAMQDSALCLSILAISAAIVPSRTGLPAKNVTSLTLVGEAIQEMRSRIDASPGHISDVTIVAAAFLWAVNAWLGDGAAMKSHGNSVQAFVENRGGLAKLGMVGAVSQLIRWIDIMHSLVFTEPCRFQDMPELKNPPQPVAPRYGSFWSLGGGSNAMLVDTDVSAACQATCHLIQLIEEADVDCPTPAGYLGIVESLRHTYTIESVLRAKYWHSSTLSECVCFAMSLVKTQCLYGGVRITILTETNAINLVKAIKGTGGPSHWQRNLDALIWLLFILVMLPDEFEDKEWCMELLCQAVVSRFINDDDLPANWKSDLQRCLNTFIWSERRFSNQFDQICETIVRARAADMDQEDDSEEVDTDQDATKLQKPAASLPVVGKRPAK